MRRVLLFVTTYIFPSIGILLLLWLLRPSWLQSDDYLSRSPKTQFWRSYIEAAYLVPIGGLLIIEGFIAQGSKLLLVPTSRTKLQYGWLALLFLLSALLAIPITNWLLAWQHY